LRRQFSTPSFLQGLFGQQPQQQQYGPSYGPPSTPPFPTGGGMPPSAPPQFVPQQASSGQGQFGTYAVDPGAVRPCVGQFVYLWLDNGRSCWAWLTFVGRRSVAGDRWAGYRWVYFGIDIRRINSFVCY
jgi:hypothetical protein